MIKKLVLNKMTVSNLNNSLMDRAKGGFTPVSCSPPCDDTDISCRTHLCGASCMESYCETLCISCNQTVCGCPTDDNCTTTTVQC